MGSELSGIFEFGNVMAGVVVVVVVVVVVLVVVVVGVVVVVVVGVVVDVDVVVVVGDTFLHLLLFPERQSILMKHESCN